MPAPRSSRWRNYPEVNTGTFTAVGRVKMFESIPADNTQELWRHFKQTVAIEVENTFSKLTTGYLVAYKVDGALDPTLVADLEAEDTAMFHVVPFAVQAGIPFRYTLAWKNVKVNEFTKWGTMIVVSNITGMTTMHWCSSLHAMLQTRGA